MRSSPPRLDGGVTRSGALLHTLGATAGFSALSKGDLATLADASSSVELAAKDRLHFGDHPGVYLVESGRGRVVRPGAEDRSLTLHYVNPGDLMGEGLLIERVTEPEEADELLALGPMNLVKLPADGVRGAMHAQPALIEALFKMVGLRAARLEERLLAVLTRPLEARLCDFIVDVSSRHGVPDSRGLLVAEKFTHLEIAQFVGATRETVTLALGSLRRQGLIAFDRRRMVVLDEAALRARVRQNA